MKFGALSIVGGILLAASPVVAAQADTPAGQGTTAQGDDEKQICRTFEETGSRLKSRRVCMTKSEWDQQRREQRMSLERTQTQRGTEGGG